MNRLLFLILFLLLLALGISFAVHNAVPITLNYYFGSITGPLSLVVVIALAVGAMLGVSTSLLLVLRQRRKVARLKRKLDTCEQEIRNLRHLPLHDKH
jgi:putative membrane protein